MTRLPLALGSADLALSQDRKPKKNLIIDTDLFSDVDDAGALLLASTSPHINLLGVLINKPSTYSVLAASAIVSYYTQSYHQKKAIPIGVFRHPTSNGTVIPLPNSSFLDVVYWHLGEFASKIAFRFGSPSSPDYVKPSIPWGRAEDAWSAVSLYRKLLSGADDESVTIASIGFLDNLSLLLDSGPDSFSPLTGRQLITQKVTELVVMGGRYPMGKSWNFFGSDPDIPHRNGGNGLGLGPKGTANVINEWPTPQRDGWKGRVVYVGDEVGGNVLTGAELVKEGPKGDPVGRAYGYYAYGEARPSWDPVAVLYAMHGLGELFKYDEEYGCGRNWVDERDGSNQWVWDEETKNQFVLALKADDETVASEIDHLFLEGARSAAVERAGPITEEAGPKA
ncbi:Inosine/uridine-preferring nucleoside hydrolase domain-containing protein [Pseudoneurospora amorphoporcata]|uniref:Inosine/uridine-preferring nucleoside hydrolase domain-containing protein n=1 Tax=Pseudoneurospora amorphoporcata TaxID=241081 RepID=A0AAN6NMW4_9PEZI|nr:Inosine/uridine-preferring nucleoside hydrolase domain-containing protein [Pseudoneurospora amorphoporcata]